MEVLSWAWKALYVHYVWLWEVEWGEIFPTGIPTRTSLNDTEPFLCLLNFFVIVSERERAGFRRTQWVTGCGAPWPSSEWEGLIGQFRKHCSVDIFLLISQPWNCLQTGLTATVSYRILYPCKNSLDEGTFPAQYCISTVCTNKDGFWLDTTSVWLTVFHLIPFDFQIEGCWVGDPLPLTLNRATLCSNFSQFMKNLPKFAPCMASFREGKFIENNKAGTVFNDMQRLCTQIWNIPLKIMTQKLICWHVNI